jgi:thiol-disulfide isomerase/thioredoxin
MKINLAGRKELQNIFTCLLAELHVKHTQSFSNKYFREHPYRNSMFGLSRMLWDYYIENKGLRIKNKVEVLPDLEAPFIAHIGTDFITVIRNSPEQVEYVWRGKRLTVSPEEFISRWSGIVLLAEPNENSAEPDYHVHHKQEILSAGKKTFLACVILLLLGMAGYSTGVFVSTGYVIALLINLAGMYIGYLLINKQMHVQGSYADRICSLLAHRNDCNSLLESDAAWFFGLFSWSEIGLGYFTTNILLLLFQPSLYPYAALINLCVLPYTLWSIWYQKRVAGQWCPLCLTVQVILWLLFFCNRLFGLIRIPVFTVNSLLLTGCIYTVSILLLNFIISRLSDTNKTEQITQEINSLKADERIFSTLLKSKAKYEVYKSTSSILWGNPEAKHLITVVTNPHCNPCAKMHTRLEQLLKDTKNGYCVQYILTSFNEELEESSKLFIAMYQQNNVPDFLSFLKEWYETGRNNRESFYEKYPLDRQEGTLISEFQRHRTWLNETKIRTTPTVLFNGYELPENYKVEDLKYFTGIEIM